MSLLPSVTNFTKNFDEMKLHMEIALDKLKHLDEYGEARHKAAMYYNEALALPGKIKVPVTADFSTLL